ncbi:hypothetical protein C7S18_23830 (plasmid) [Ahniella affigens]|uniref:Polymerase nucleotidyl transferase domain-containing protein n=1 Tax=Ahniella affigens TaxID=2021234 RepID=A0A2P1PZQ8_9GAMM|nr:hypothetical protein C7S18_23830 [Ahniella affigens]
MTEGGSLGIGLSTCSLGQTDPLHGFSQILPFIEELAAASPDLRSVWLIGSRANGTSTEHSDWDFIAIGSAETLLFLRGAKHLHREKTDFLVVTNGDDFEAAWGGREKTGSLTKWQWTQRTESEAEYMQSKWVDAEDGSGGRVTRARGIRVWPRSAS